MAVRNIMLESPSLIDIDIPEGSKLTVCGDTHGNVIIVTRSIWITGINLIAY